MAGGGYLNIAAEQLAFDGAPIANSVSFYTSAFSEDGSTRSFALPRLSENDQFMSAPLMNRLVYTTPAINTLFVGTPPLSDFKSMDRVTMGLQVNT